ncbi:MAG: conjugative transfer system coupling protein TraD [Halothiobacillaceae bacterium]
MRWFEYDYILRPNVEFWAFCGWVAGGLGTLWLWRHSNYPVVVLYGMLLVCGVMGSFRGLGAWSRYCQNRRLLGHSVPKISFGALRRRFRAKQVWLGLGFAWSSDEVQKATDILKGAPAELMRRSRGQWIHGVGGQESDLRVKLELLEGHTLIIGTTGAGKTRLFDLLVAQAILRDEAVIIIDPKGDAELRENARRACAAHRGEERFAFFHPAMTGESVRIDPMRNWNRATELASRVAALIPTEAKADPFAAFGWMALNAIVQGLVYVEKRPNLVKLRHYIEIGPKNLVIKALEQFFQAEIGDGWPAKVESARGELKLKSERSKKAVEDLDLYIAYYNNLVPQHRHEQAVDGLISAYLHNWEHFQKMVASLNPILAMLTTGDMRHLLSPHDRDGDPRRVLDLKTVLDRNMVLYLGLDSLSDPTVGSAIGSIMLADLTAVASDRYNFMPDPPKVNIFIDEAAEVVNDPAVQLLNKSRGAGFRVFIATQTLADLEVRTGTEAGARQVLGNTNNWIILRSIDGETQKYISEALPKVATRTLDLGYRSGATAEAPADFTGTYTESLKEAEQELMPAALLGLLPNLHYFCRLADGTTWKGRLPILEYT